MDDCDGCIETGRLGWMIMMVVLRLGGSDG